MVKFSILFLTSIVILTAAKAENDKYQEELKVVPVDDDYVNTYFSFDTKWQYGNKLNMRQSNLVSKEVSDLLKNNDVKELHFSITRGLWMHEKWGYPITGAPNGVESWGWYIGNHLNDSIVESKWKQVIKQVANILRLNLNIVGRSISPKFGFRPKFVTTDPNRKYYIRYMIAPFVELENDNLIYWKKLLPCGWTHGLASLLTSKNMKRMKYISLSFEMITLCQEAKECSLKLAQTANLVLDLNLFESNTNEYSLARLFDQGFDGPCNLSETSTIHFQSNNETNIDILSPDVLKESTAISAEWLSQGQYEVAKQSDNFFDRMCLFHNTSGKNRKKHERKFVHANRFVSGDSRQGYQVISEIINTYNISVPFLALDQYPWFVEVNVKSLKIDVQSNNNDSHPKILYYTPAGNKSQFTQLDVGLLLKPKSNTTITLNFTLLEPTALNLFSMYSENWISSVHIILLPFENDFQELSMELIKTSDLFNATLIGGYYQLIYTDHLIIEPPGIFIYLAAKIWSLVSATIVMIFLIETFKWLN